MRIFWALISGAIMYAIITLLYCLDHASDSWTHFMAMLTDTSSRDWILWPAIGAVIGTFAATGRHFASGSYSNEGPAGGEPMAVNPATGLPMMGGGVDAGGSPFGVDIHRHN